MVFGFSLAIGLGPTAARRDGPTSHWSSSSTTPMTLGIYCLDRTYFCRVELQEHRGTILVVFLLEQLADTSHIVLNNYLWIDDLVILRSLIQA